MSNNISNAKTICSQTSYRITYGGITAIYQLIDHTWYTPNGDIITDSRTIAILNSQAIAQNIVPTGSHIADATYLTPDLQAVTNRGNGTTRTISHADGVNSSDSATVGQLGEKLGIRPDGINPLIVNNKINSYYLGAYSGSIISHQPSLSAFIVNDNKDNMIDGNVVRLVDTSPIHQYLYLGGDKGTIGNYLDLGNSAVDWSTITGKPSSTSTQIDTSVSQAHTHNNKSLLDTITNTGSSTEFLAKDGQYHTVSSSSVSNLQQVTDIGNTTTKTISHAPAVQANESVILSQLNSAVSNRQLSKPNGTDDLVSSGKINNIYLPDISGGTDNSDIIWVNNSYAGINENGTIFEPFVSIQNAISSITTGKNTIAVIDTGMQYFEQVLVNTQNINIIGVGRPGIMSVSILSGANGIFISNIITPGLQIQSGTNNIIVYNSTVKSSDPAVIASIDIGDKTSTTNIDNIYIANSDVNTINIYSASNLSTFGNVYINGCNKNIDGTTLNTEAYSTNITISDSNIYILKQFGGNIYVYDGRFYNVKSDNTDVNGASYNTKLYLHSGVVLGSLSINGTVEYMLGETSFNNSINTIVSTARVDTFGIDSIQVYDNNARTNYSNTTPILKDHLDAINQRLGELRVYVDGLTILGSGTSSDPYRVPSTPSTPMRVDVTSQFSIQPNTEKIQIWHDNIDSNPHIVVKVQGDGSRSGNLILTAPIGLGSATALSGRSAILALGFAISDTSGTSAGIYPINVTLEDVSNDNQTTITIPPEVVNVELVYFNNKS